MPPSCSPHWAINQILLKVLLFTRNPFIYPTIIIRYYISRTANWEGIGDEGARFENLIATSLLKRLHFLEDRDGYRYELRYIRDKEGREVEPKKGYANRCYDQTALRQKSNQSYWSCLILSRIFLTRPLVPFLNIACFSSNNLTKSLSLCNIIWQKADNLIRETNIT